MRCHSHPFAVTAPLRQLQNWARVAATHGAGLVRHQPMAAAGVAAGRTRGPTQAAPPADLFRTKVHEGLGTSESDPYTRTLPNQESIPPESSVLQAAVASAPTQEEIEKLPKKWGLMQYWIGDTYPRLPLYLAQLAIPHPLPVSPTADELVGQFEAQIPLILHDQSRDIQEKMLMFWRSAVTAYDALALDHIFDRQKFERGLKEHHRQTLESAQALSLREEPLMALEVLRRKTILRRNKVIREGLIPLVEQGTYFGFGDGVWRVFFEAVDHNKPKIFGKDGGQLLGYVWDAIMDEDVIRTPSVTACVALYLTLLSVIYSPSLVMDDATRVSSNSIDEGIGHPKKKLGNKIFELTSPIRKRKFAEPVIREILESVEGSRNLSKVLRSCGMHELSREAALCEAINDSQRLLEADAAALSARFDSTTEVKSLLASIMGGTDEAVRSHVASTFGISPTNVNVDWDKVFMDVDWPTHWRRLAVELLSNTAVLTSVHQLVKNVISYKGSIKRLFNKEYEEELQQVIAARQARVASKRAKTATIVAELTSFRNIDQTLEMLRGLGVPMEELEYEAASMEERLKTKRPTVDPAVLKCLLEAIGKRHPTWIKAGVLPPSPAMLDNDPLSALEMMVRIFVRLVYLPQAGAASIAQHFRRRIGAIGKESFQYNVPTEMGIVEQYDNLQYKRYDWQGWYQRMVDVHNRNVSIRCRIDHLRRLDNYGAPLVDLQTERRLRIICGDRVGMGVLKLDSNKYEDQADNITHGTIKLSEILAESRKAQLGPEYWPTVEVKVRRPSGQTQAYYSNLDNDRIEKRSKELYKAYTEAKKRSLFVTPMDLWLEVKGAQARKAVKSTDSEGYTIESLEQSLGDE
ncbi:unnamed protein product [Phytomonas sp. EM1]|nr:unnamed protein product [Phytomonas sp. EM1]|eukprot:CCW61002.1 unnamed protein product [Phytomonas sp. isolate EM1]